MEVVKETLLISHEEVKKLFNDLSISVKLVEESFMIYDKENVILPDKISQIFNETSQERINCMSASLLDEQISGVKWVSVFPNNPKRGLKNVSGIIVLSNTENGYPLAIIDGTEITSIRTAAVGACAVKYLARQNSKTIGFIGAGKEARMHFKIIKSVMPLINKCYISSRTNSTVSNFIDEMKDVYKDVEFINCGNKYQEAIVDSDIIVTATSTQDDILKAAWIKKGATYIHVGGWEDEFDVVSKADKIICDRWESVKHRGQTVCRMYKKGLLHDSDIYADFNEIISFKKIGRSNDDEFIYFNSVGLAFIDIYFAKYVYDLIKTKEYSSFVF